MDVAAVVIDTIRVQRAYDCTHDWQRLNEKEEQCTKCTIIATPDGKVRLQELAARYHRAKGRP